MHPRKLLFALAPLLLLAVGAESGARLAGDPPLLAQEGAGTRVGERTIPPDLMPDPLVGWAPRPLAPISDPNVARAAAGLGRVAGPETPTRHDARGWREAVPPDAQQGPQVLLVGDSSVWGSGVAWEGTLGRQLARAAAAAGATVDVRVGAAPGWSSVQMMLALDRWLDGGARPAVVVLYPANSDQMIARGAPDEAWLHGAQARARPWLGRSVALRWLLHARDRARPPADGGGPRVRPVAFASVLRQTLARVRAAGAVPVVLVPPSPLDAQAAPADRVGPIRSPADAARCATLLQQSHVQPRPGSLGYRCAMALAAAGDGVPLIDGPAAILAAGTAGGGPYFWDTIHPTAAGHAVLAAAVWPAVQAALGAAGGAAGAAPPPAPG